LRRLAPLTLALALAACGPAAVDEVLPVLGEAPAFALTNQDGARFESDSLRGSLWIADFIFTRCTDMCPILSREMAKLEGTLREDPALRDVRLVSFSIDPDHDQPAVLAAYAKRFGAETRHWTFATGTREEIWTLSVDGFKLAVGEEPGSEGQPLFHSDRFVVVDANGRIRGYYSGMDADALERLVVDLRSVASEPEA
jgi:protein SCO1/2